MKATAELKMLPVSVLKPAAYNPRKKLKPVYGDNVFEKCGINRDGAGEVGKPRYFNGKRHF